METKMPAAECLTEESNAEQRVPLGAELCCSSCALKCICLPARLPACEVRILEDAVKRGHALPAGASLIRAGRQMQALYVIRSGSAKGYRITTQGEETVHAFYLPGEAVGLEAFAAGRHACEVVALEPVRYCMIPVRRLERLMEALPGLRREIVRLLSQAIEDAQRRYTDIGYAGARERLAGFLVDLSRRLERRKLSPTQLRLSMSRRDIAHHLGLTLETVSRVLGAFKREGWIEVRLRHIKLLQPQALASLAGGI